MNKGKQVSLHDALKAPENTVFLAKNDGNEAVRVKDGKLVYHFTDTPFTGEAPYGMLPFIVIGEVIS